MSAKDLTMRIIMNATGNAKAVFNDISLAGRGLSGTLSKNKQDLKDLEKTLKQADKFADLQRSYKSATEEANKHTASINKLAKEMKSSGTPTKQQIRDMDALGKKSELAQAKQLKLGDQVTKLGRELKGAGFDTKNFAKEQARMTAEAGKASGVIEKQKAAIEKLSSAEKSYQKAKAMQSSMNSFGVKATATGAAIGAPVAKSIYDFATEENAFLDVVKQIDGIRDDKGQITKFGADIRKSMHDMARQNNVNFLDVYDLFSAAGRNGLKELNELNAAALTSLHTTVALELPDAKQAGDDLTKIAGLYRIATAEMMQVGDVINYLDDSTTAKGSELINVIQRAGNKADQMGFKNMAGLAATLLETANGEELSGTGIKTMVRNLSMVDEKSQGDVLKKIGLSVAEVRSGMQTDGYKTFRQILEGVATGIKAEEQMDALVNIFGVSGGEYANTLLKNRDKLDKNVGLANSQDASGSVSREAGIKNSALSAAYQSKFKNNLGILSAELGQHFKPILIDVINKIGSLMEKITAWAQQNPRAAAAIGKVVAGVSLLLIAIGSLTIAMATILAPMALLKLSWVKLFVGAASGAGKIGMLTKTLGILKSGIIIASKAFLGSAGLLAKVFGILKTGIIAVSRIFLMNPIGFAISGIIFTLFMLWKYWDQVKAAIVTGWSWINSAFSNNPILNFIFPFVGMARLIINNWSAIGPWFSSMWNSIKAFFGSGIGNISAQIINWSPLGLFHRAMATVLSWFGVDIPLKFSEFGANLIQGLIDGIKKRFPFLTNLWHSVSNMFSGIITKANDIHSPSRVMAKLGGYLMQGLGVGVTAGKGWLQKQFMRATDVFKLPAIGGLNNAIKAVTPMSESVMPKFIGAIPASEAIALAGGNSVNNGGDTFNIYITAAADKAQDVGKIVQEEIKKIKDSASKAARSSFRDRD